MLHKEGLTPQEQELHEQIQSRTSPTLAGKMQEKLPDRLHGKVDRVLESLNIHKHHGFDQGDIPRGFLPQKPLQKLVTRTIIGFADPSIIENRVDKDVIKDAKEHLASKKDLVVVIGHLSHTDGPQIQSVLESVGIPDAVSVLGIRIIRNKVAKRLMQGVDIVTVYPDSEQFWKKDDYKAVEPLLSDEEMQFVQREKSLSYEMQKNTMRALNETVFGQNKPIILFPEGTRRPGLGLGEPVKSAAGLMTRGNDTKILVMSLMGTENLMPKGKGMPRFAKVQTRFVDIMDPSAILNEYQANNPGAKRENANDYLLDRVMTRLAEGLDVEYRGIYADSVEQELQFTEVISKDSSIKKPLKKIHEIFSKTKSNS